jgi:hypothetical protein
MHISRDKLEEVAQQSWDFRDKDGWTSRVPWSTAQSDIKKDWIATIERAFILAGMDVEDNTMVRQLDRIVQRAINAAKAAPQERFREILFAGFSQFAELLAEDMVEDEDIASDYGEKLTGWIAELKKMYV